MRVVRGVAQPIVEIWSDCFPHITAGKLAFEKFNKLCHGYTLEVYQPNQDTGALVYIKDSKKSVLRLSDGEIYLQVSTYNHVGISFTLNTSDYINDLFICLMSKKDGTPYASAIKPWSGSSDYYSCNFDDIPSGDYRISFGFGVKTYEAGRLKNDSSV